MICTNTMFFVYCEKKSHQWNTRFTGEFLFTYQWKEIVPRLAIHCSLVDLFSESMSNRQTVCHSSSRFFQNAFQRSSRQSRAITLWVHNREKITRGMGTRIHDGTTGAIHSCRHPSGLIMHRGLPKGNLADAVKTVVLYAYTDIYARLDPTYVRR